MSSDALAPLNALPVDFPMAEAEDLCRSLEALPLTLPGAPNHHVRHHRRPRYPADRVAGLIERDRRCGCVEGAVLEPRRKSSDA